MSEIEILTHALSFLSGQSVSMADVQEKEGKQLLWRHNKFCGIMSATKHRRCLHVCSVQKELQILVQKHNLCNLGKLVDTSFFAKHEFMIRVSLLRFSCVQ